MHPRQQRTVERERRGSHVDSVTADDYVSRLVAQCLDVARIHVVGVQSILESLRYASERLEAAMLRDDASDVRILLAELDSTIPVTHRRLRDRLTAHEYAIYLKTLDRLLTNSARARTLVTRSEIRR